MSVPPSDATVYMYVPACMPPSSGSVALRSYHKSWEGDGGATDPPMLAKVPFILIAHVFVYRVLLQTKTEKETSINLVPIISMLAVRMPGTGQQGGRG